MAMILIQKKRLAAIRAEILAGNPLCLEDATYLADRLLHLLDDRDMARKELGWAKAQMKLTENQATSARNDAENRFRFGMSDENEEADRTTALLIASADHIRGSQSALKLALRSARYVYDPLV